MDVVKHLVGIARDWIALPFVLVGSGLYSIGELISGKKFSRRADMAIAQDAFTGYRPNRAQRRAQRRRR